MIWGREHVRCDSLSAHVKGIKFRRRATKLIAPSLHSAEAVSQLSGGQLCQVVLISFDP